MPLPCLFLLLCLLGSCKERRRVPTRQAAEPVAQAVTVGRENVWHETDSTRLNEEFAAWVQSLIPMAQEERIARAGKLISDQTGHPMLQRRLAALAEEYFDNPNSPYRNESLFIPVLEAFIADNGIGYEHKLRPQYQLEKAQMNRPGTVAADISLLTPTGERKRLHEVNTPLLLLYFFNPECNDCGRVADYILQSPTLQYLQQQRHLQVVAVYPDEDLAAWERHKEQMPPAWLTGRLDTQEDRDAYHLPAIPNLYLLDSGKRVILKDMPVEQIEEWLHTNG